MLALISYFFFVARVTVVAAMVVYMCVCVSLSRIYQVAKFSRYKFQRSLCARAFSSLRKLFDILVTFFVVVQKLSASFPLACIRYVSSAHRVVLLF